MPKIVSILLKKQNMSWQIWIVDGLKTLVVKKADILLKFWLENIIYLFIYFFTYWSYFVLINYNWITDNFCFSSVIFCRMHLIIKQITKNEQKYKELSNITIHQVPWTRQTKVSKLSKCPCSCFTDKTTLMHR